MRYRSLSSLASTDTACPFRRLKSGRLLSEVSYLRAFSSGPIVEGSLESRNDIPPSRIIGPAGSYWIPNVGFLSIIFLSLVGLL